MNRLIARFRRLGGVGRLGLALLILNEIRGLITAGLIVESWLKLHG